MPAPPNGEPAAGPAPEAAQLAPPGGARPRFSRSPHPYHRQSLDLREPVFRISRAAAAVPADTAGAASVARATTTPADYFHGATGRLTASPSDSGTEADDERPLLKALTAPPLRPRKGLRAAKSEDDTYTSPFPTPLPGEDEGVSSAAAERERRPPVRAGSTAQTKPRRRSAARQRAGLARRGLEVGLLAAVAGLSCGGLTAADSRVFGFQVSLAGGVYVLFTLKLLVKTRSLDALRLGSPRSLLSLDPALALYPLLVPALVAAALPAQPGLVEVNLMLGLCTMPLQAVPFRSLYVQWAMAVLPLAYRQQYLGHGAGSTDDAVFYLLPLHYCLKSCLEYLTSTSLLPTEVELLSVALINLLLYADSPQTYILKSLVWVGGVVLFVSCKNVMTWTVSLARIPNWKFRKISRSTSFSQPILTAMDDALGGWLSSTWLKEAEKDSSDSEDNLIQVLRRSVTSYKQRSRSGTTHEMRPMLSPEQQNGTVATSGPAPAASEPAAAPQRSRQRRHTLPTSPSALYDLPQLSRTASRSLAKFQNQPKYYPSLTGAQAKILKWIYASFVYFMVVFTILIPIRIYVSYRALQGAEPIGWALGYLLGGLPLFRDWVQHWGLDSWICLRLFLEPDSFAGGGFVGLSSIIGPENIRLAICAHCILCIAAGLVTVSQLSKVVEVDTRRKVFHGMMVLMFGLTIFVDPTFISLCLALVLAIFLLLDLFRAAQLPPISRPLTIFLAPYVDGRDHKGPVVISPIFLLIGCAIPLWLSLAAVERGDTRPFAGWEAATRDISMVTGVVCVGMGDAAASLVGRRFGRRRWPWGGGKSLEGSAAFAAAVVVGLMAARAYLALGPWSWEARGTWAAALGKAAAAAVAASLTETVLTGANDNVLVPVALWLWVRAVGL